jgi:hypothetical protein
MEKQKLIVNFYKHIDIPRVLYYNIFKINETMLHYISIVLGMFNMELL